MCAADTSMFCNVLQTHSSFAMSLKNSDLIPPLLFTLDIAVIFARYACTPVNIAFNSGSLMWFILYAFHLPPDEFFSSVTSDPNVL